MLWNGLGACLITCLPVLHVKPVYFFFSYPGFSGERNSYIFTETPNFKVLKSMIILRLTPFNVFVYLPIPTQTTMFLSIGNLWGWCLTQHRRLEECEWDRTQLAYGVMVPHRNSCKSVYIWFLFFVYIIRNPLISWTFVCWLLCNSWTNIVG